MTTRILIFANKTWEAEPLVGVLQSEQARPPKFADSDELPQVTIPLNDGTSKTVRARHALKAPNATAEIWCVKDLMDPSRSSSSSEEKARVLPFVAQNGAAPGLVVAFGTATIADPRSYNGCVVVGTSVFVYNPYANNPNPESSWKHPDIGKLLDSSRQPINSALFGALDRDRSSIEARLLSPPVNAAMPPTLVLSPGYVALSDVNVTNPSNYVWADAEALGAFASAEPRQSIGSVETTHGVIRLSVPSPQFVFVSGIANRLGYFNMEVAPRLYAQNFVASHNAAICLAWMIPALLN